MSEIQVSLEKEIKNLMKTGKYCIGARGSLKALKRGEAKILIIAENTPPDLRERAYYYAKLSGIKIVTYNGRSVDLGLAAGKSFPISMIAVLDTGTSRILDLVSLQG